MSAPETSDAQRGHERKDADVFSLFMVAGLVFCSIGLVLLVCWGLMHFLTLRQNAREKVSPKVTEARAEFPEPRLQTQPGGELQKRRAREEAELNSYGWVDRKAGLVRIPIERAMQLITERGLPEVGAGLTPLQLMQARPSETALPSPKPEATP